ncbi:hypothetical protein BT96DRAFT_308191 [Gymnopus androsaceus JB14]|uniref:DUF7587 domain-containing protein n=1 Tax=Gymnopus androsaceus JB14 TaxID=1447944 RepID=A0A6A4H2R7_9AGAR|nr:hypothetical protein BT96DRAFT_308191 [Gymnopus androsaceus JB14]
MLLRSRMPIHLFRAYSTHSGAVFNERRGFVARGAGTPFDPTANPKKAREIIINHLDWHNTHFASPLISASTEAKSKRIAAVLKKNDPSATVYIAEIVFGAAIGVQTEPVVACNMCSVAGTLGVDIPCHWRDPEEYVFVHGIPLSCIVEVRRVDTWNTKGFPSTFSPHWRNPRNFVYC